jgi:hypothetical protein
MMSDQEADACTCEQCTAPKPAETAVNVAEPIAVTLGQQAFDPGGAGKTSVETHSLISPSEQRRKKPGGGLLRRAQAEVAT